MTTRGFFRRLARDNRGATAIEFAMLGPSLILMMFGILTIGLHMQSFNSARSIAYDVSRYTIVEYQKENRIEANQIREVALAIATSAPYNFNPDNLSIVVEEGSTGITGADRYDLTITYAPIDVPLPIDLDPPTIQKTQAIIVPE